MPAQVLVWASAAEEAAFRIIPEVDMPVEEEEVMEAAEEEGAEVSSDAQRDD